MAVKSDTSITIRVNKDVKIQAQRIFAELGLDMSTAVNVFLRKAIRQKGFPFDVRIEGPIVLNDIDVETIKDCEIETEKNENK